MYKLITPSNTDVVTLAEAKKHLRISHTDEDTIIQQYIDAAVEYYQEATNLNLRNETFELYLDKFPEWELVINKNPVTSIDSIQYYDLDNASQNLTVDDDYFVDLQNYPGRVVRPANKTFPATYNRPNAVKITFKAGLTAVPKRAKQAILLLAAHFFVNREAAVDRTISEVPLALQSLLNLDKVTWLR